MSTEDHGGTPARRRRFPTQQPGGGRGAASGLPWPGLAWSGRVAAAASAVLAVLALSVVAPVATAHAAGDGDGATAAGRALFEGQTALQGQLTGHTKPLPAAAVRCSNCHRRESAPPPGAAASSNAAAAAASNAAADDAARSFGSWLGAEALQAALPRRGGPPSRYDAASLCKLLREGIDPAWVVIDRAMPRYEIADAQCQALWAFLSSGGVGR